MGLEVVSDVMAPVALLILFGLGAVLLFAAWSYRQRRLSGAERLYSVLSGWHRRRALRHQDSGRALRDQDSGPPDPEAQRHELAVLRFCCDVLKKREAEDSELSWLWSLKREVAAYAARHLETALEPEGRAPPLTEPEEQAILRDHPLLQTRRTAVLDTKRYANEPWFKEIEDRIKQYSDSVRARE